MTKVVFFFFEKGYPMGIGYRFLCDGESGPEGEIPRGTMMEVEKYFAGTMMEARRLLEPVVDGNIAAQSGDESSEGSHA